MEKERRRLEDKKAKDQEKVSLQQPPALAAAKGRDLDDVASAQVPLESSCTGKPRHCFHKNLQTKWSWSLHKQANICLNITATSPMEQLTHDASPHFTHCRQLRSSFAHAHGDTGVRKKRER